MSKRLYELAKLVDGQVTGNDQAEIQGIATLSDAGPGHITLAEDSQHIKRLAESRATAAIIADDMVTETYPDGVALITVSDPREAFAVIVRAFCPVRPVKKAIVSPAATISPSAKLGDDVSIGAGCVIGDDVRIGDGSVIHPGVVVMDGSQIAEQVRIFPNAVLYENTIIGPRCIIHAAAVLGAFGFGYESSEKGHLLSEQLGFVVLEADVEIGAGTTIDRGTYGATRIGQGTKMDNQVMIGHNCNIGKHNLLCGQAGIAGSCTTGEFVVIAGQVGLRDHIDISDNIQIGARAAVANSLTEPGQYLGTPAVPIRQEIQSMMSRQKLPVMRKQLKKLARAVESLEKKLSDPDVSASEAA